MDDAESTESKLSVLSPRQEQECFTVLNETNETEFSLRPLRAVLRALDGLGRG